MTSRRNLALDVLRFLAVLLVLFHHMKLRWLLDVPLPFWLTSALVRGGWIGVDLFFVLSGFLIAGLLFREHQRYREIRVLPFLVRRGLKIYPAFYVFLLVSVVVRYHGHGDVPVNFLYEAVFLQNYLGGVWGHTWSLAIEEHFYLALPVLLLFLTRSGKPAEDPFHAIPRITLLVAVVALGLRIWRTLTVPEFDSFVHFRPTHMRMDALMFGVFLAYLHHYHGRRYLAFCRRHACPLIVGGVWLWLPAFLFPLTDSPFLYSLGFTQVYLGAGMIMSAVVARGLPDVRPLRVLAYLGMYSYSTYLWHLPVRRWASTWYVTLTGGPLVSGKIGLLLYMGASLVLGVGAALLIEVPVLRLRDRLMPSRSRPLSPSGAPGGPPGSPEDRPSAAS